MSSFPRLFECYGHTIIGLIIVGVCLLSIWRIQYVLLRLMQQRMNSCLTAAQANLYRLKIDRVRRMATIFVGIITTVSVITVVGFWPFSNITVWSFIYRMPLAILLIVNYAVIALPILHKLDGNISVISFDEMNKKESFSILLRGFLQDDKGHIKTIVKTRIGGKNSFSEYLYCKKIKEIYAVGNPKEIDAPFGATRVYLDSDKWQEQIRILLDKAQSIHVRVCNTESCKWELEQAVNHKGKTAIIVDNYDEYNSVRESFPLLPPLYKKSEQNCATYTYIITYDERGSSIVERYRKTDVGYEKVGNFMDAGRQYGHNFIPKQASYATAILFITLLFALNVPKLIQGYSELNEVSRQLGLQSYTKDDWLNQINEQTPVQIDSNVVLRGCSIQGDGIVFYLEGIKASNDSTVVAILVESIFHDDIASEHFFYNAVFEEHDRLVISCRDSSSYLSSNILITEDDLINKYHRMTYHIPSHRSPREQWNWFFEDYPTENEAMY